MIFWKEDVFLTGYLGTCLSVSEAYVFLHCIYRRRKSYVMISVVKPSPDVRHDSGRISPPSLPVPAMGTRRQLRYVYLLCCSIQVDMYGLNSIVIGPSDIDFCYEIIEILLVL